MERSDHLSPAYRLSGARRPRFRPERPLPRYAYLPGSGYPHPVRHPAGHSFGVTEAPVSWSSTSTPEPFLWGVDLFNHCYYWEAHEAWEPFWQGADRNSDERAFLKAMILLAAAGVKVREGKRSPKRRHLERAAALLDGLNAEIFAPAIGMPPQVLASLARDQSRVADPSGKGAGLDIVLQPQVEQA